MNGPSQRPPWGWDVPARLALVVLLAATGTALAWSAPGQDSPPPPSPALEADPNTAPTAVLGALPGLGPALSGRIVEGRADGPFASLDDLDRRVKGIGPAKAGALAPFLRFDPPDTLPTPPAVDGLPRCP